MGPCPLPSKLGFKYFFSFVDDYSQGTWIHMLKSRSDVFLCSKFFIQKLRISSILILKVCYLIMLKKYFDNHFSQFLEENKILHQFSCVYTP